MLDLSDKRIIVTGGNGFLGQKVVDNLKKRGCVKIFSPRKKDYDLVDTYEVKKMYNDYNPEVVIHLAAVVGGIGANKKNPGKFFYENLMMGLNVIEEGRINNVEKMSIIGTICSYPKFSSVPFKEDDLWIGYPEETNAPYGIAKKALMVQSQSYREEYGFNSIFLLPVNMYGPGDNFNLETSHVIPAIIKKCIDAINKNEDKIICWGTGDVTREFMYVEDAARAIVMATELYDGSFPINVGTGIEITIKDLTCLISELTGFAGDIIWDESYPNGQPRRCLDISKAKNYFGFEAKMSLEEGLKKTIDWYKKSYNT